MTSNTLCVIPWNHLAIQQNGDYRACCQCLQEPFGKLTSESGEQLSVLNSDFDTARNAPLLKDIRAEMLKGNKPTACQLCWDEEATGLTSRRQHINRHYDLTSLTDTAADGTLDTQVHPLKYMDLRFGNLCNQACRSCSATDSSLWYEDAVKLGNDKFKFYGSKTYAIVAKGKTWELDSDDFLWYQRPDFERYLRQHLNTLDRLYFTGGEPTVNKEHFRVLDLLIAEQRASSVSLDYNTNLMAVPDALIDRWSKFRRVSIGASLDAFGVAANYVRWPSTWDAVSQNLIKLDKASNVNLGLGISSTISILNVLSFLDLTAWLLDAKLSRALPLPSFHMLQGPQVLNVQILPEDLKTFVANEYHAFFLRYQNHPLGSRLKAHLTPILVFMNAVPGNKDVMFQFFKHMGVLDVIRHQRLLDVCPWLSKAHSQFTQDLSKVHHGQS